MTYTPSRSPLLKPWSRFKGSAAGRWLVSWLVCLRAPYFRTIRPRLCHVAPGHVELVFRKRWGVTNHIGTVHAIAMCNAAELAGGLCMDVSLDANHRWIPVGMGVQYLKMAKTDLRAVCQLPDYQWRGNRDVVVPVSLRDTAGVEVLRAEITMRISPRA